MTIIFRTGLWKAFSSNSLKKNSDISCSSYGAKEFTSLLLSLSHFRMMLYFTLNIFLVSRVTHLQSAECGLTKICSPLLLYPRSEPFALPRFPRLALEFSPAFVFLFFFWFLRGHCHLSQCIHNGALITPPVRLCFISAMVVGEINGIRPPSEMRSQRRQEWLLNVC